MKLTVIFTTFNEAPNIAAALNSVVGWATEIIVVDSFSTDETVAIVQTYPQIQILQRTYMGPADQKNWAIPKAKNEWILLMDADERATAEMKTEIDKILEPSRQSPVVSQQSENYENPKSDCYWIGFTHYFMDKKVRYSGWQNDKTIRLIRRDKCRYNDNRVHEEINTEGVSVGFLQSKFEHYTFRSLDHFIAKQERYAAWSALDYEKKTGRITAYHLIFKPFFRFFKHFCLKLGFLDGRVGLVIATVAAWSVFLRYAKMAENRQRNDK